MLKFGIGQSVRRVEDTRFLTGAGAYTDDLVRPELAHAVLLRSVWAHARIRSINVEAARRASGVLAVYTSADLDDAGVEDIPCVFAPLLKNRDGSPIFSVGRPALARNRAMYVGDGLALIVAETVNQAKDASELIDIDVEELPAAANLGDAIAEDAPVLWDGAPANVCFDWEIGDVPAVDAAFAAASHVTRIDLRHNRITPNAMETRAALGEFDPVAERYTLTTSTQGANGIRDILAGAVFGMGPEKLRVVTADVGGGFGMKARVYPEQVLVLFAARAVGRPVKWTGDRSEAFQSDVHGRDVLTHAELAIDANHRITALRVHNRANMGGYLSLTGPAIPTIASAPIMGGVYAIPAIHVRATGYFSNSVPTDAYRGAGRPEAAYLIERAVDQAARELGLAADEFRRLNFIPTEAMPYRHPLGYVFDSGDFALNMRDAQRAADWAGFSLRRAAARDRGKLRGIGLSTYIESTLGYPTEAASIAFLEDDWVEIATGTMCNGQGHATAWAQLIVEQLGVPFDRIRLIQGDTDRIATGQGTAGSHSLYMAAGAFREASLAVIDKGKVAAARMLDVSAVEFSEGVFSAPGTNKTIGIMEVAARAGELVQGGLDSQGVYKYELSTFPNGCHVCEVEIDPDTGKVDVVAYSVVDDFGRVVNPMIVEGQVHGGIAQGLGQALMEDCLYDSASGQLITGSFMDYGMPRADDFCHMEVSYNEIPCTTNPYGVKGCGEAGTTGSCPAIMNAILDALWPLGIRALDMPATPLKVWRAIQSARMDTDDSRHLE